MIQVDIINKYIFSYRSLSTEQSGRVQTKDCVKRNLESAFQLSNYTYDFS